MELCVQRNEVQRSTALHYIAVAKCKPKKIMAALRAAIIFLGFAFVQHNRRQLYLQCILWTFA
jgi:hypothetical protein